MESKITSFGGNPNVLINKPSITTLKLNKKINEYLKKDYNIKLMDMTIREIYEGNISVNRNHSK